MVLQPIDVLSNRLGICDASIKDEVVADKIKQIYSRNSSSSWMSYVNVLTTNHRFFWQDADQTLQCRMIELQPKMGLYMPNLIRAIFQEAQRVNVNSVVLGMLGSNELTDKEAFEKALNKNYSFKIYVAMNGSYVEPCIVPDKLTQKMATSCVIL